MNKKGLTYNMAFKVKIIDTAAFVALAKELGLIDAAGLAISGDYMGALNSFFNNIGAIFASKGSSAVLGIIFKYAAIRFVIDNIPGTGKTFSFLGMEISI